MINWLFKFLTKNKIAVIVIISISVISAIYPIGQYVENYLIPHQHSNVIPKVIFQTNGGVYTFNFINNGGAPSENLKATIYFNKPIEDMGTISFNGINDISKIHIINGDIGADFFSFEIPELHPGDQLYFNIKANGKTYNSMQVWSESEGDISKKIIIGDISLIIGPEKKLEQF